MIDERMFVIKNAVSNNNNSFFVHNFLKSERDAINFDVDVFINTQLNEIMSEKNDDSSNEKKNVKIDESDEIDEFDEFENRIDSTLRFLTQDFVFASDFVSTSVSTATVRETSRSKSTSTSKFTFQNVVAISARRRSNVKNVLDDFAKKLRSAQAMNVEKKRIRNANFQIINRQNIQTKSDFDKIRLKFEKKQYRNNQRSKLRQQTIAMKFRQNELNLKREKNDLTLIQNKIVLDLTDVDEHVMNI